MAKASTIKVIMRSTESPYFFTTRKNKANKEKLVQKSYDPTSGVRKHVDFKEEKMK